jgi:predicted TPR repeat methyltransferase
MEGSHADWQAQHPRIKTLLDAGTPLAKALRYTGLELWRDGHLEKAAEAMAQAASIDPREPVIHAELGALLGAIGRKEEALQSLGASLELDPNQVLVWVNLANIANELGNKTLAEQAFLAALELAPDSPEGLAGLGLLYIESRRFEDAVSRLRAAVDRGATEMAIHACLGQALHLLGDFSQACLSFEQAARAFPNEAQIVRKYAQARLLETVVDHSVEKAIEVYQETAGSHAEETLVACKAAFHTLSGYGRTEAALRLGHVIHAQCPDDPVIAYHLDALTGRAHERAPDAYLTACFDKYAPTFDKHLVEMLHYRIPAECQAMLIEAGVAATSILDLGCGTGLAASYLSSYCAHLTGVDISPGMLAKAKERNMYDRLIESEAVEYLQESDDRFDLIVSLDVLVYFGELTALLAAAARPLSSGGVLAISFETGRQEGYTLLPSGRFAHDPAYVERAYQKHFACISRATTTLRLEANRPVAGQIVLLRRL